MFSELSKFADRHPLVVPVLLGLLLLVSLVVLGAAIRMRLRSRREVEQAHHEMHVANIIKNDFVAMVSHELRTPLTSIAGFAEMLQSDWKTMPQVEVDEFLDIITRQAHYLGDLVEDVLVIPRLEAGRLRLKPELFDLSELVHEVKGLIFPDNDRASVSIPGGVMVWGDPRRAQQVLRNLIENARKYGGDRILIEGFPLGDHFVVVVSDNGQGVPEEMVNRVFEHFEQISKGDSRSSSGIGLGLPIARRLARAMGGEVWYEKRFPTGSRFCFSITQTEQTALRVMQEREAAEQEAATKTRQPARMSSM